MFRQPTSPIGDYFEAIKSLHLRHLVLVLKAGYDPNLLVNKRGQNGLQFMISYFSAAETRFRLQAPVNKAAYLSIAKLLLESGLDPNTVDLLSGDSAIFDAIRVNDKDMVLILLNHVDFSLRNRDGETALMCAARFGSKQVMRLILDHLKSLDLDEYFLRQRNRFGMSALDIARSENLETAKVLTKHLITSGHHATGLNPMLTRSSSHQQLYARSLVRPLARGPTSGAGWLEPPRIGRTNMLMDDLLLTGSDYDSDLNGSWHPAPSFLRRSKAGHQQLLASQQALDSRAADFNQQLQASQFGGRKSGAGIQQQQDSAPSSDEDANVAYQDYECDFNYGSKSGEPAEASFEAGPSGLKRSKSCILGPSKSSSKPSSSQQAPKYGGPKK